MATAKKVEQVEVDSEQQEVTVTSPAINTTGVQPQTSVTLPDGTVIQHY
jgi:hypothetical protein